MPRSTTLAALVAVVLVLAAVAGAAEWGAILPGTSTLESVRAQWGPPTRSTTQKVEGYDSVQWVYEGTQAPPGVRRLTIDFGLLTSGGYKADVVRTFRLDPRPGAFDRRTILNGWGKPERVGKEGDATVFFYDSGLLVYFDKEGWLAQTLVFTPPQPPSADGGEKKP